MHRKIRNYIKKLDEITKQTPSKQNPHIPVGRGPSALGVIEDKVYVANSLDNTVSVLMEKIIQR
jgi:DNA-binding beta-propeller fold protein YncE